MVFCRPSMLVLFLTFLTTLLLHYPPYHQNSFLGSSAGLCPATWTLIRHPARHALHVQALSKQLHFLLSHGSIVYFTDASNIPSHSTSTVSFLQLHSLDTAMVSFLSPPDSNYLEEYATAILHILQQDHHQVCSLSGCLKEISITKDVIKNVASCVSQGQVWCLADEFETGHLRQKPQIWIQKLKRKKKEIKTQTHSELWEFSLELMGGTWTTYWPSPTDASTAFGGQ